MICTRNCLYQFDGACGLKLCSSDATNRCPLVPDEAAADTPYKPPMTNADHIRAMSDEELADLLCTADWCETCDQMREEGTCKAMELDGPLNKHCVSAALRWLRQPYKEET